MKKVVVRVSIHEKKDKKKALKAVSSVSGIDFISVNVNDKTLTVIGDVDPIEIVGKLRKTWHVELLTVGPDKETEKKDDDKKSTTNESEQAVADLIKFYRSYSNNNTFSYMRQPYDYSVEDNPNSCVIC